MKILNVSEMSTVIVLKGNSHLRPAESSGVAAAFLTKLARLAARTQGSWLFGISV